MKKIEAYIRPESFHNVKSALSVHDLNGMSVSQVMGFGSQKGWHEFVRGSEVDSNILPKIKLEIIVPDDHVEGIIDIIINEARTGEVGDGKIFISTIDDAIRIRTGERGLAALYKPE